MPDYIRPPIPEQVFYDDTGAVINYGNRWNFNYTKPNELYSVTAHPERFAPLHTVADALIEHLRENYNVTVTEDIDLAVELNPRYGGGVTRAVRIVPANADGSSLTMVFTGFPGIVVRAGLLHDFIIPPCGCDACDDSIDGLLDELEGLILAVAAGGFKESISSGPDSSIRYDLRDPDGSGHSESAMRTGADREREAEARLRELPNGWQPWRRLSTDQ